MVVRVAWKFRPSSYYFVIVLHFVAICSHFPRFCLGSSKQVDCSDQIDAFHECVNTTLHQRQPAGGKIRMMKVRVNNCLQQNKCVRLYLDVIQDANDGTNKEVKAAIASQRNVFECMKDFRDHAAPLVEKCISQLVPGLPHPNMKHHENKWTLIQQATNKTLIQQLCAHNGSASNAAFCIDRLFTPSENMRKEHEKHFQEFCTAARQCRAGMGLCRTELDNGRKAHCDCVARVIQQFDTIRHEVPSCAGISRDTIKSVKRFHPLPFLNDCGPNPCDSVPPTLTHAGGSSSE